MRELTGSEMQVVVGGVINVPSTDHPAPAGTSMPPAVDIGLGISEQEAQWLNGWISGAGMIDDLSDYNVAAATGEWDGITGHDGIISSYTHSMYSSAMKTYCLSNGYGYVASKSTPGVCVK